MEGRAAWGTSGLGGLQAWDSLTTTESGRCSQAEIPASIAHWAEPRLLDFERAPPTLHTILSKFHSVYSIQESLCPPDSCMISSYSINWHGRIWLCPKTESLKAAGIWVQSHGLLSQGVCTVRLKSAECSKIPSFRQMCVWLRSTLFPK